LSRTRGRQVDVVADVPDQNKIRVWIDAATGMWKARIGPEHAAVEQSGPSPWSAMMLLQLKLKHGDYEFDATMRSI
jgi:hypothetical protein